MQELVEATSEQAGLGRVVTEHMVEGTGVQQHILATEHDEKSGACYSYNVATGNRIESAIVATPTVRFQRFKSPAEERNGFLSTEVLEMLIDHLRGFQEGPFCERNTAIAITHLETAMLFLQKRIRERISRGVYGERKK